jgi:ribonuclease HII
MATFHMPCTLRFERQLWAQGIALVAGIDEAGRGPLAGPVVAAAVILSADFSLRGLNDSKKLSEKIREEFFEKLTQGPTKILYGIGMADSAEIDRYNILRATHLAMKRAVEALPVQPDHLLIDGRDVPLFEVRRTAIVDGDALSRSIAAASVIAKVTRDRLMSSWHAEYPVYDFDQNKGYATAGHLEKLRIHGPCPIHRRSFEPVYQPTLF